MFCTRLVTNLSSQDYTLRLAGLLHDKGHKGEGVAQVWGVKRG